MKTVSYFYNVQCAKCALPRRFVRAKTISGAVRRVTVECRSMTCAPQAYEAQS